MSTFFFWDAIATFFSATSGWILFLMSYDCMQIGDGRRDKTRACIDEVIAFYKEEIKQRWVSTFYEIYPQVTLDLQYRVQTSKMSLSYNIFNNLIIIGLV